MPGIQPRVTARRGGAADSQRLDLPDRWAIYGALYTDAQRLCEEVQWLREALGEAARTLR